MSEIVVSIIIPVFDRLAFTRQCLDRIARNTDPMPGFEALVVDNGSTDGTAEYFRSPGVLEGRLAYHRNPVNLGFAKANNIGAGLARGTHLLFLNNDTLVQPGWLEEMLAASAAPDVGIVGIKQLFPYTSTIHHTGLVFTPDGIPLHVYAHADARLPQVNHQREYQAVNGACLLVRKDVFDACGRFDEGYVNGYEDVDLCMAVRERGLRVVCCTSAFIYHYGQISETRTAADDRNAIRFRQKWASKVKADEGDYLRRDAPEIRRSRPVPAGRPSGGEDAIYFADDLGQSAALTWVNAELALAVARKGRPVALRSGELSPSVAGESREPLSRLMVPRPPADGIHVKWSHYWPQHLGTELCGRLNLELFAINYSFAQTTGEPWDRWLQCVRQNHHLKLPISTFCRDVLLQIGVPKEDCRVVRPGYSPEVDTIATPSKKPGRFRFLTVTNSHDLERYGTEALLDAYWSAFEPGDDVILVLKDYGAASGDTTLRNLIRGASGKAAVEYQAEFTSKARLIRLYKASDAFVSAHRGEGYGMKILDALACGLPTITPLFGGPADYCTPDNCFPVDYDLVPLGDCTDARALAITNGPTWAEPIRDSLVHQLRTVATERDRARAVGQAGRRDTIGRFTWDAAAGELLDFVDAVDASRPKRGRPVSAPRRGVEGEDSPYWRGLRVSVLICAGEASPRLAERVQALERQTVLPQELEVVVVDGGSTRANADAIASLHVPFRCRHVAAEAPGLAAARNTALRHSEGELVLYLDEDVRADERLVERHLVAHAEHPEPFVAILGQVDDEISDPLGYRGPAGGPIEGRFFRTRNASAKRAFLLDAADAGVAFDGCFGEATVLDAELGFRLEQRGMALRFVPDAVAYDERSLVAESLLQRERRIGEMAVLFYRKHPALDDVLDVGWIGDSVRVVSQVRARPELLAQFRAVAADTESSMSTLAGFPGRVERLRASLRDLAPDLFGAAPPVSGDAPRMALELERTRGKVRQWYDTVADAQAVADATLILAWLKTARLLTARPRLASAVGRPVASTAAAGPGGGPPGIADPSRRRFGWMADALLVPGVFQALRRLDRVLQRKLPGRALDAYAAWRVRLKSRLF